GRVDVSVLGRDHVDDGRRRHLAYLALQIRIRDRLEQDLEIEGQGDQRLGDRVQEGAFDVLVHVLWEPGGAVGRLKRVYRAVPETAERRPGKTTHGRLS